MYEGSSPDENENFFGERNKIATLPPKKHTQNKPTTKITSKNRNNAYIHISNASCI